MAVSNREFGDLLTQGLKSIAAREDKSLLTLEDFLGEEMSVTRFAIEKWRQGNAPSDAKKIDYLARVCVQRGGMDQHWLSRFLTQASFAGKAVLIQELFPTQEQAETTIRRNFPRRPYEKFVGREQELATLQKFLSPRHRHGVICLSGPGGVGKTALAIEIAHCYCQQYAELLPEERFEAIVWVTAKQIELLPKGPATRRPTFTDLDGAYRALAEVLDLPAITRAATAEERDIIIARTFSEHRILLVMDNLEDIDDSALLVFLRDLPVPSKAIVTTRHRIDVALPLQLHAFNEIEACELIRVECQRHELSLTPAQAEKLLLRTGCLALAIVRTIGRMAWRGSGIEAELQQLGNPANSIYDFCFERSIASIRGSDAHQLFMTLVLFPIGATRAALGYIAGFQEDVLDRDEGLSSLEILSLVNKDSDRFGLEVLTKVKAQAELDAHPGFEQEIRRRWIEWYKLLAIQAEDPDNDSSLNEETNNLLEVIDWLIAQGNMIDASWFFQRIRWFLYAGGHWSFLRYFAERLVIWAESVDNSEMLASTLHPLTRIAHKQGNFTYANEWLERIQISAARLKDKVLQAHIWLIQGKVLHEHDDLVQGEIPTSYIIRALEVFRQYEQSDMVVEALNELGNIYSKQQYFDKAVAFYREGIAVLDSIDSSSRRATKWLAILRGNLALAIGRQGQYTEACKILYEIIKNLTDQTDFAEAYAALALYEFHMGHTEQAQLLRRRAEQIMNHLNLARPFCLEDEEWERLH